MGLGSVLIPPGDLVRESRTRSLCQDDVLGACPWHEGIDVAGEVAVGMLRKQAAQIGIGLYAGDLACANETGGAGPVAAALIRSSVMMPGVWGLARMSRIRFTRFAIKRSSPADRQMAMMLLQEAVNAPPLSNPCQTGKEGDNEQDHG